MPGIKYETAQSTTHKLYKDLWVNKILPKLDGKSLLKFSSASSETREIGLAELLKRDAFTKKLKALKDADTSILIRVRVGVGWVSEA